MSSLYQDSHSSMIISHQYYMTLLAVLIHSGQGQARRHSLSQTWSYSCTGPGPDCCVSKNFSKPLQADLAAVLHLVGALNAWQAERQLASATQQAESEAGLVPPAQTSVLLECGLTAHLQHIPQVTPLPLLPLPSSPLCHRERLD